MSLWRSARNSKKVMDESWRHSLVTSVPCGVFKYSTARTRRCELGVRHKSAEKQCVTSHRQSLWKSLRGLRLCADAQSYCYESVVSALDESAGSVPALPLLLGSVDAGLAGLAVLVVLGVLAVLATSSAVTSGFASRAGVSAAGTSGDSELPSADVTVGDSVSVGRGGREPGMSRVRRLASSVSGVGASDTLIDCHSPERTVGAVDGNSVRASSFARET